jgi:hypothetical protein
LAVYRCGGLAVFFGGVTWQNLKAVGSFANHWSEFGRRNSSRGSGTTESSVPLSAPVFLDKMALVVQDKQER